MNEIQSFYQGLKDKKIAFIGAGVSHRECILLFCQHGARVTLCDQKKSVEEFGEYAAQLQEYGVTFSLGEHYLDGLQGQDWIMRTPGFPYHHPALQQALQQGVRVTSEMELFFQLCPCKKIAITGSDGKTTTTTLIAKMLEQEGKTVHLGGNLGRALLPIVHTIQPQDWAVVELSSFQLISMRPIVDIAVVTNVTPNHLDHHKDMQEYIDAKRNLLLLQKKEHLAVLGWENQISRAMKEDTKADVRYFSRFSPVEQGGFLRDDGMLCLACQKEITPIIHKKEMGLRGEHNIENLLAAMTALADLVSIQTMQTVASNFCGVEHRIEPVRTLHGVQWFNDSIATSPTRVIAGLQAFSQKLIIIAGGSDKGVSFEPLVPVLLQHVKLLILTGATAQKIEDAVKANCEYENSQMQILRAQEMSQAVQLAYEHAKEGDIVSLSPACASFDAYPNFEERGKHYKQLVQALR